MRRVLVERLESGMVLAAPVTNEMDQLLFPAEFVLTDKHIQLLRSWGIGSVDVQMAGDDEQDAMASIDPKIIEEAERSLKEIFHWAPLDNPTIEKLFKTCMMRKARRMASAQGTA